MRELALRVSALEEELHRQRVRQQPMESASLKPAALVLPRGGCSKQCGECVEQRRGAGGARCRGSTQAATAQSSPATSVLPALLPGGATLNYMFDGYYEYDFNHPIGRIQYLRAYDVLSNAFSINQADVVFDLDPDVAEGRRYGVRVDLQFGQATETLQGNPSNEARPEIYRNIFQAYGTYVVPAGQGAYGGLRQVGQFAGDRGELYEGPGELFAVVLLRLSALLPHGCSRELQGER